MAVVVVCSRGGVRTQGVLVFLPAAGQGGADFVIRRYLGVCGTVPEGKLVWTELNKWYLMVCGEPNLKTQRQSMFNKQGRSRSSGDGVK